MCGVTQRDVVKDPSIYITTNFKTGNGVFYYINFVSIVDQDEVGYCEKCSSLRFLDQFFNHGGILGAQLNCAR